MPKTPEEMIKDLKQDALKELERSHDQLDTYYDAMPEVLKKIQEKSGMEQSLIMRAAFSTQFYHSDIQFPKIIAILNDFFISAARIQYDDKRKI